MRTRARTCSLLAAGLVLGGCVSIPPGPSVMALPGSRTSFEQFQVDDYACRTFAGQASGTTTQKASEEAGFGSAVIGTAVGAAAGAAIGAATGQPATGAAIGAGSGLLLGAASGVARADASAGAIQQRYDQAYLQCMYAKGNQIPMQRSALQQSAPRPYYPPPPRPTPRDVPPQPAPPRPPAGPPPPPPPDA